MVHLHARLQLDYERRQGDAHAPLEPADEGRRNLLTAFYKSLDGIPSAVPLPTFDDGLRHVRFAEAAIISARRRAWVEIEKVRTTTVQIRS